MNALDRLDQIIKEAISLDDAIESAERVDEDVWRVSFESGFIEIDLDPETERLTFAAPIGSIQQQGRGEFHELMLLASGNWRKTRGAFLALSEGDAVQGFDMPLAAATPKLVAIVLHNMKIGASNWRDYLSDAETTIGDAANMMKI